MTEGNPWISRPAVAPTPAVEHAGPQLPAAPLGPTSPQGGVPAPDEAERLPFVNPGVWSPLWVVGAHGGAGETSLAAMIPGATPTGHAWPQLPGVTVRAVVVCRSSMGGLRAAQAAAQQWAAGLVPGVDLLGLVVLQDAPGRLPRVLRDHYQVVAGGFARSWTVPWIESWRLGDPITPAAVPREARRVVDELTALANNQQKEG